MLYKFSSIVCPDHVIKSERGKTNPVSSYWKCRQHGQWNVDNQETIHGSIKNHTQDVLFSVILFPICCRPVISPNDRRSDGCHLWLWHVFDSCRKQCRRSNWHAMNNINIWAKTWQIKLNENKSNRVNLKNKKVYRTSQWWLTTNSPMEIHKIPEYDIRCKTSVNGTR